MGIEMGSASEMRAAASAALGKALMILSDDGCSSHDVARAAALVDAAREVRIGADVYADAVEAAARAEKEEQRRAKAREKAQRKRSRAPGEPEV